MLTQVLSRLPILRYLLKARDQRPSSDGGRGADASVGAAAKTVPVSPAGGGSDARGLTQDIEARLSKIEEALGALHASVVIREVDFGLQGHPRYDDPRRLLRYAAQVCSQNGEDGMIAEIFRRIGTTDRVFVEIGVEDGRQCNTAFLLSLGWEGYWLDGDPSFVQTLTRPDLPSMKFAVGVLTRENVAKAFSDLGVPSEFDLLSIDIDQNTYYIWEALRDYRPRVVVVEYNASVPADIEWKVRYAPDRFWDGSNNFGASLKAFESLGRRMGYSLVGCDLLGVNAFFVRSDLTGDQFASPLTAENHYEPPRYHFLLRRSHPPSILDRVEQASSAQ